MILLTICLLASATRSHAQARISTTPVEQVVWTGYGGNAQHTAMSNYSPSGYNVIAWSAPLDSNPPYSNGELLIHYGSVSLTSNTLVMPYRSSNTYEFIGRNINGGGVIWSYLSSYKLPPSGWDWTPPVDGTLLPDGSYAGPSEGGGVFIRPHADSSFQPVKTFYPFPSSAFGATLKSYINNVYVVTPITADSSGNLYYGIRVLGAVPNGMNNAFVKVSETGTFTFYNCAANHMPCFNAGPTLSNDGGTIYAVENVANSSESHIIALNTATMQKSADATLLDPFGNWVIALGQESTASPMVGPDGDVYFGAMFGEFDRGWLLHFDSNLNPKGATGAFGWDDTPSVVPSSIVTGYTGSSSYLICCKYNKYIEAGLPGNNMVAILDPNATAVEPNDGIPTMKPVVEVLGVTHDNRSNLSTAVREWCINSAAVDVNGKTIVLNSEDGRVYKWDLTQSTATNITPGALTGALTAHLQLTDGIGEAYTPTVIAADGTVFAVDNARIYAVRAGPARRSVTVAVTKTRPGPIHAKK